jgi:hypothetical protein
VKRQRATHDCKRNGTTTLFAALKVATGKVTDQCYDRHGKAEFLDFLKKVAKAYPRRRLHVVVDNYHTHKHPEINAWLAKNPRVTLPFTQPQGPGSTWSRCSSGSSPDSHPARVLEQCQGARHRDQRLHRRLERPLPPVHLDQDRRRDPAPRHP